MRTENVCVKNRLKNEFGRHGTPVSGFGKNADKTKYYFTYRDSGRNEFDEKTVTENDWFTSECRRLEMQL